MTLQSLDFDQYSFHKNIFKLRRRCTCTEYSSNTVESAQECTHPKNVAVYDKLLQIFLQYIVYFLSHEDVKKGKATSSAHGPSGYNITGYNITGYNIRGYNITRYNTTGYNITGYNITEYNITGHNITGYNVITRQ